MNVEAVSGLKVFVCGAAAVALTAIFAWSFVESTAVARWNTAPASVQIADAGAGQASHTAQAGVAALVD